MDAVLINIFNFFGPGFYLDCGPIFYALGLDSLALILVLWADVLGF